MPYTVRFTNNKTGKSLVSRYESYTPAYRALSDLAYAVGYEVHSIHAENMVVAGSEQSDYFIVLIQSQPMKTIEKNLPELKAIADQQAGLALQMYKIMKSTFHIIEEMNEHMKCGECPTTLNGPKRLRRNIVEYITLLDKVADGCVPLSNMR